MSYLDQITVGTTTYDLQDSNSQLKTLEGNGAPTTSTIGQTGQFYYDLTNHILYHCSGENNGSYIWNSVNITVDSALSSSSTNPVQNNVINTAISAKYTKPSNGIPASDLASDVIPSVPSAYSSNPAMNGTASPGSGTAYALGDHVHPTDTSRQETLVSGTNIKTVNGNSLLGSGDLTVSGLPSVTTTDNGKVLKVVNGEWEASTGGSGLTDPGTLPSLTTTVSSETLTITWSAGTLPS